MKKNRRKDSQGKDSASSEPSPIQTFTPPPLEWGPHAKCLGSILKANALPFVVTCDKSCLPPMDNVNFDFAQPLLLHTRRTVRKVVASNVLHVQLESGSKIKDVGDRLLIPEDYKGWFAVLGRPDEVKADKVVPHFRQVAGLALSKCESFLVGGNEPVTAVQMPCNEPGRDSLPRPRLVYPGDVLRMGKLYVGESKVKVKKSSLFGGTRTVRKEEKFLLCTDHNDRDLYLRVESRGTFYMVTTEGSGTPKIPILRLKDICTHYRFPCVVKLLFGRVPSTPCSFTGTLVLHTSQIESSVIGCTLLNIRNILLDLPVDSDLRFFTARNTSELLSSRAYLSAKGLCQDKATTYMRNMKVAYYVNTEEAPDRGDAQEDRADDQQSVSDSADTVVSRISRQRPSIVEDQELFNPLETTPKSPAQATPCQKKAKKSIPNSETTPLTDSVTISSQSLKKDVTYNLPEPAESLPLRVNQQRQHSVPAENRPLPSPACSSRSSEGTPTTPNYIPMDQTADQRFVSKVTKPSTVASKTPPPTPPKPRKNKPPSHSPSDESTYTRVWDGESKMNDVKPDEKATPVLRPKRLDVPRVAQRVSSISLADTYLTFPVFRGQGAAPSTPGDDSVPLAGSAETDSKATRPDTESLHGKTVDQPEEPIYKVPSSLLRPVEQRHNQSSRDDQPYEIMTNTAKLKHDSARQSSLDEQTPPSVPPKTRSQSSPSLSVGRGAPKSKPLPPIPDPRPAPEPHGIVFENGSWLLSDTSLQSCEYASTCLSSQGGGSTQDLSDPYVHMQRESFNYYDGYDPNRSHSPDDTSSDVNTLVTELADMAVDQSAESAAVEEQAASTDESEELYVNIENMRVCREKLSASTSLSDITDDNHVAFFDRLENPPSIFGYLKPPPPRPATPKKPPPVPKKPSSGGMSVPDEVFALGNSEAKLSQPPKFCKPSDSASLGYLHACPTSGDYVQMGGGESINALPLPPARFKSSNSDVSQQSSEDDLPLGATFANFRSRVSDSGCVDSVFGGDSLNGRGSSDLPSMSVAELGNALKKVGLAKETVEKLRQEKVDGTLLASLDEKVLRTLPGMRDLDMSKIKMFIKGWRPVE
ncbi:uncharacterized protein LOC143280443 [Babylonia areolata]|uniref:uncharacterized protein LOC143280443 n=1 Tax=Babylonia areolata TaxID=304850 RepID=UPI003FD0C85D